MGIAIHKTHDVSDAPAGAPRPYSAGYAEWRPGMDSPWRRFGLTIPAAAAFSALLIAGFAIVLTQGVVAPPHTEAVEVRLVEIQPVVHALQGNNKPKITPRPIPPVPRHEVRRRRRVRPAPVFASAPPVTSPNGIAVPSGVLHPAPPSAPESAGAGGGGIGSDTIGARAIYAPKPVIPDDLRENVFQAEAIARFIVGADGAAQVTLEKPTSNPRLNQVLLDTLKEWKFFPAIENGVAVASTFEVRIPISVE
ncbi:MAG: energy transducer TonB [Candidatus Binataceae bacterium]